MRADHAYAEKLARFAPETLLPLLEVPEREAIEGLATRYRFSFSELRLVAEAARDLQMWREPGIGRWWPEAERAQGPTPQSARERKKRLLAALDTHLSLLRSEAKRYPERGEQLRGAPPATLKLARRPPTNERIFGLCPAYSPQSVCCGLHTLDAVTGCSFGCSYCTIQTFYGETATLDEALPQKLAELPLEAGRFYHIGTGQSSDSLVWGNRGGVLDALVAFAERNPQLLLELKTKSERIDYFLEHGAPPNLVVSWTLNPDAVIRNEEHRTASLERRLEAASRIAAAGVRVAFHFHPMVHYAGWREDYTGIAAELVRRFRPEEVLFLTMGSVTLIRPVVQEIRRRGGESKILQMELIPDHHGKLTYPDEKKIALFGELYRALSPWHREVFFYLCMEPRPIWEAAWGFCYPENNFEARFAEHFRKRCGESAQKGAA